MVPADPVLRDYAVRFVAGPLSHKIRKRKEQKAKASTVVEGISYKLEKAFTDLCPDEPVVGE